MFGDDGVRLFFVLSAFLITGILLRLRDRGTPLRAALRVFYTRRFLRIWPAYYVLLAVVVTVGLSTARRDAAWHALYLSNWRFLSVPWTWPLNHLWTLSVEEQFYLAWPLVVLCAPRRHLPRIFVASIALAILARLGLLALIGSWPATQLPTPISLDALGAGALLAWHRHIHPAEQERRTTVTDRSLLLGSVLLVCSVGVAVTEAPFTWRMALEAPAASLISVWLVERGVRNSLPVALLTARPVRYLGTISYGVYLWHAPVLWALHDWRRPGLTLFAADLALTLVVASASWFLLERPLNRLKRLVPYGA